MRFNPNIKKSSIKSTTAGMLISVFGVICISSSTSAASLLTETFSGSSTATGEWLYGGNSICLTAGDSNTPAGSVPACSPTAIDAPGDGVLRLTSDASNQAGFVILNTPLNSSYGFSVTFDMYKYGTAARHADGVGFFLVDGSMSPTEHGGNGGALGYGINIQRPAPTPTTIQGIEGGYVGVGFDTYGNYSVTECPIPTGWLGSCSGISPNAIGVRGSQAAQYQLIQTSPASGSMNIVTAVRDEARRTVNVTVSPNQLLSVAIDYHDGNGPIVELANLDISAVNGQGAYPDSFKVGFSGSTGAFVDYHEIRNLSIETLYPDLTTTVSVPDAPVYADSALDITVSVRNLDIAAPTLSGITSITTLPDGIVPTAASGSGWACNITGQIVTCTRSGAGANALGSGEIAPLITITTTVQPNAVGSLAIVSAVSTDEDTVPDNNTHQLTVVVENRPAGPLAPVTPVEPGVPNTGVQSMLNDGVFVLLAGVLALVALVVTRRLMTRRA